MMALTESRFLKIAPDGIRDKSEPHLHAFVLALSIALLSSLWEIRSKMFSQ